MVGVPYLELLKVRVAEIGVADQVSEAVFDL